MYSIRETIKHLSGLLRRGIAASLSGSFATTMGFVVALLFIVVVYRSLTDRSVTIEPFELPGSLQSQGYSGRVLANRLVSALMDYRRNVVGRPGTISEFPATFRNVESEIEVEAGGFSSKKLSQAIAYVFSISPVRVSGEVTVHDDHLVLTVRAGGDTHAVNGKPAELDSLISGLAPTIIKAVEPYFFALDVADRDPHACLTVVRDILRSGDRTWRPWAYNLWGTVLDKQHKPEAAREKFRAVLDIDAPLFNGASTRSAHAAAHNNLGLSFMRGQDYPTALMHFRKAVELMPDYASAYGNLATALVEAGQQDEAMNQYTKAIDLTPERADLYHKRGVIYRRKGDLANAAADLKFSRKLDESEPEVLYDLGATLVAQGNCKDAVEIFNNYTRKKLSDRNNDRVKEYKLKCAANQKPGTP